MVKGYLEYIAEHFGAITIEYPPEDMFVKNPNLPQPLSINTWVGGTGRIQMQWNNSPYLSGGFGGSGYGRFGQDPDGNDSSDPILDYLSAFAKIEELISKVDNTEYVKIGLELKKELDSAIEKLDAPYRSVFVIRDIEQLSVRETAKILKISEDNVKTRLRRARIFLRNQLAEAMV